MARVGGLGLASGSIRRVALLWVWAAGFAGWSVRPLPGQEGPTPTLHVYTNLVQIPTLVLDQNLKPVAPIAESRFFVSLDGGPRFRVTHVRPEGDDPISLAVVLDVSQPFPNLIPEMGDALAALVPQSLHAKDHVSVYSMDCSLLHSANALPADPVTLKRSVDVALQAWRARGRDRWKSDCKGPLNLWDSLNIVSQALYQQPGRRVILVVTDGVDRGSRLAWNALRETSQARGEAIFGLTQIADPELHSWPRNSEDIFNSLCQLSGGIVLTATEKSLQEQLRKFMELVRGRYIVEFPHPVDTIGGYHGMDITIEKSKAVVLATGVGVPVDDPAVLRDPTTVPVDPSSVPQVGKRKVLSPN